MLPFVFSMEQKTSSGPVWTAGNDVREDGAEPGRLRRAGSGQPRRAPGDSPTTTTLAVPSSGSRPAGEAALRTPGSRRTRLASAPAAATHGLRAAGEHLGSPGSGRGRRPSGPPPQRHVGPLRLACCPRRAALHPRATPGPRAGDVAQVDGPASLCSASNRCHAVSRLRLGEVSVTDPRGPGTHPAQPGQAVRGPTATRSTLAAALPDRTPPASPPGPRSHLCCRHTPPGDSPHGHSSQARSPALCLEQRWCGGDT